MLAGMRRRAVTINDGLVMGILIGFFAGAVTISLIAFSGWFRDFSGFSAWVDSFAQNFGTEMFGAFLTFYLIEMLRGSRREREAGERAAEERKRQLIRQLGSIDNATATNAASELRASGWLEDGSLRGAHLREANLAGADLRQADLSGADLRGADLEGARLAWVRLDDADLNGANLSGASLLRAKLREANLLTANLAGVDLRRAFLQGVGLWEANMANADVREANLSGADLRQANLAGASLWEADLARADLQGAKLDAETRLPDGSYATTENDVRTLARFTDLDHPEFWRSDAPKSPAYRGADDLDDPGYESHKRRWPDD